MKKAFSMFLTILLVFALATPAFAADNQTEAAPDYAGHWAEAAMEAWVNDGLIDGFPDGTFRPNGKVTRAQFAKLVNSIFGFEEEAELNFPDVKENVWYTEDIAKAVAAGYFTGYPDGTMQPNAEMSRQEVAELLKDLLVLVNEGEEELLAELAGEVYADTIPAWSKTAVGAVTANGYMEGYEDDTFRARNIITRAEAVTILDRVIDSLIYFFDEEGVFGPEEGSQMVHGNVFIEAANVTLQNLVITRDLVVAEGLTKEAITLDNVTVRGGVYYLSELLQVNAEHSSVLDVTVDGTAYTLSILVQNGFEEGMEGFTADDFTVVVRGQEYVVGQNTNFTFTEIGDGEYSISFDAGVVLNESITIIVDGVVIEENFEINVEGSNPLEADLTVSAEKSSVVDVTLDGTVYTFEIAVQNDAEVGIEGFTADDFTIEVRGVSHVVGQNSLFTFNEIGNGEYSISFNAGIVINETINIFVDGVQIEEGYVIN